MKIEKLETVWIDAQPNTLWLRIHTDNGLVGLGETYYAPRAVAAIIHDVLANLLIGQSAFDIENHWANMFATVNFFGFAGAETRAISAVDIALWDLLGQYTGQPIYNLLGGKYHERLRSYTYIYDQRSSESDPQTDPDRSAERALAYVEMGFTA